MFVESSSDKQKIPEFLKHWTIKLKIKTNFEGAVAGNTKSLVALAFISVSLAFEPAVGENRNKGHERGLNWHHLSFLGSTHTPIYRPAPKRRWTVGWAGWGSDVVGRYRIRTKEFRARRADYTARGLLTTCKTLTTNKKSYVNYICNRKNEHQNLISDTQEVKP